MKFHQVPAMRIFVGTLYTIENEFEECVASIEQQSYRNFEHFIFRNLPKKEAHDALYRTFMDRSDEFDLLIKVDADMVIEDEHLFAKIVNKFQANDWLQQLQIAVYDFFSDQLIDAMHTYRNSVKWQKNEEDLFTDLSPVPRGQRLKDYEELAPAAIHCRNPSPFQSFHYGVHRGLKIMQLDKPPERRIPQKTHWNNFERVWWNFQNQRDRRLGLAVLAAELVFKGLFKTEHLNYSEPYAFQVFREYESHDVQQIEAEIRRLWFSNWGFLPSKWRREVLCYLRGGHPLSKRAVVTLLRGLLSQSN